MNAGLLTAFSDAVDGVTAALTDTVGPALIGAAVVGVGISLAIGFVKKIRSAV